MEWTRHGPLVGAILYVVAVATVTSGADPIPPELAASLQLHAVVFASRAVGPDAAPPGTATGASAPAAPAAGGADLRALVASALEPLATRFFADPDDRLRGAQAAAVVGARELVPLYAGPLAATNPAAEVLVRWSMDPAARLGDLDLLRLRWYGAGSGLDVAAAGVLAASSDGAVAEAARAEWADAADRVGRIALAVQVLAALVLLTGAILWIRLRRHGDEVDPEATPLNATTVLPLVRVWVFFAAVLLTVGLLGPRLVELLGGAPDDPLVLLGVYLVQGLAGLYLVARIGPVARRERLRDLAGWAGSFRLRRLPRSILWGIGGYCLIWPIYLGAAFLSTMLFGAGGDPFENPIAILLATRENGPATATLLVLVAVLAPFFEESLFRGYLHGRLRRHFPLRAAAWASGLAFAGAHLSAANLLPLAAVGFSLAVAYDRTRDLVTPMVAHGLWNATTALALMAVFS